MNVVVLFCLRLLRLTPIYNLSLQSSIRGIVHSHGNHWPDPGLGHGAGHLGDAEHLVGGWQAETDADLDDFTFGVLMIREDSLISPRDVVDGRLRIWVEISRCGL